MKTFDKNAKIIAHIDGLIKIAELKISDASTNYKLSVFRSLRRMECKAHRLAIAQCDSKTWSDNNEKELDTIEKRLRDMFANSENVGINRDPRGMSLKIFGEYRNTELITDWGGNILIAPEF